MTGKIHGWMTVLALSGVLAAPAALFAQAQGQPPTTATPQVQPAVPVPQRPKPLSTDLGRDFTRVKPMFPNPIAPYTSAPIPPAQFTNSPRVQQQIQNGRLLLTLQDAIELALENNTDIMVQRYFPALADLDLIRTEAGAGARGAQSAGTPGPFANNPNTGSFDPAIVSTVTLNSRRSPVNNPLTAGTGTTATVLASLFTHNTITNVSYLQSFPTGTSITASLNTNRASTTSQAQFFSPSVQTVGLLSVSQQLLNGFGSVNKRFIRIARLVRQSTDYAFAQSVLDDITNVQNLYWELVFARGSVGVNQRSVELAQRLYEDNQRQVEIGTLAPLEVVRAEAQLASAQQNLIAAQTSQLQQQALLLNAIVKDFIDPTLINLEVVPTDTVQFPPPVEDLPLGNAIQEAMSKRPDVQQTRLNLTAHEINVQAVRNALLPTITFNGFVSGTGLAGNTRGANAGIFSGLPSAMTSVVHGEFPEYQAQITMNIPIRNRAGQADMARALLVQQQDQARLLQLQNTVAVDVQNTQIALRQARAAVGAAQKTRQLQEQALQAEQTRFQLGASTIFLVVQAQRDLSTAASSEVRAQVDLAQAQADFERAMGRTLEVNRIDISEAKAASAPTVAGMPNLKISGQLVGQNRGTDASRSVAPIQPSGTR